MKLGTQSSNGDGHVSSLCVKIITTRKSSRSYHVVHNIQLLKANWGRQAALVAMKTKSRSRLNVEDDLICASSCVEPRISVLSNRAAISWYFRGEHNDCKLMLYLTTKYVFAWLRPCFLSRLGFRTDCSERCVTKSCSYFFSVYVQQLSKWRSCIRHRRSQGGPKGPCTPKNFYKI